jgi:hypothetical protein
MPVTADQIEQGTVLLLKGGAYLLASQVVPHTSGDNGGDLVV